MISKGQFLEEFDQVLGSFSRNMPKALIERWFLEVEETEFKQFRATLRALAMGEHWQGDTQPFPKYPDFWRIYKRKAKLFQPPAGDLEGCANCRYGWIHFHADLPDSPKDYEYVAPCLACQPKVNGARDPGDSFRYVAGLEPYRYRNRVLIRSSTVIGMFQELADDMKKAMFQGVKVDWQKKEIEAWAQHKAAGQGRRA